METDITQTTYSDMENKVGDYKVKSSQIDEAGSQEETYWYNDKWSTYNGYLKSIPEFKEALKALARWAFGRGYEVINGDESVIETINGWGEDGFTDIIKNLSIVKNSNGDAYAEIIRSEEDGRLLNLKPLNPSRVRHVINRQGVLKRYDVQDSTGKWKPMDTSRILHLCNDRIASEIHGRSKIEACKWVIDTRNEAMADWRRISHRSTIRVLYVDVDNTTELSTLKREYAEAIDKGEVLILPGKKTETELADFTTPPIAPFLQWIQYLEGFFYQAVGVPKAIANTQDFTEAASKVGYMTFEPVYVEEQTQMENDLWNQLGIKVKFNRPPSLAGAMQNNEMKNTGQIGFQPNEMQTGIKRTE